jgi:hypothetical protein
MASLLNLGRMDRGLRVALGVGLGIAGILINGHPHVGRALGITGALVIRDVTCLSRGRAEHQEAECSAD